MSFTVSGLELSIMEISSTQVSGNSLALSGRGSFFLFLNFSIRVVWLVCLATGELLAHRSPAMHTTDGQLQVPLYHGVVNEVFNSLQWDPKKKN